VGGVTKRLNGGSKVAAKRQKHQSTIGESKQDGCPAKRKRTANVSKDV
jgi:hypothetical protein